MSINEILNEINLLPLQERIWLIQQTLQTIQDTTSQSDLLIAAEHVGDEYKSNKELTAFTDIDFESFYEAR